MLSKSQRKGRYIMPYPNRTKEACSSSMPELSYSENGKVIYLNRNQQGKTKTTNAPKKSGKSSEVFHLEIEDMRKMIVYFQEKKQWLPYLIFVLSCNTARRVGDIIKLKWDNIYNPANGMIRTKLDLVEEKTGKFARPLLNKACREAIEMYVQQTGCNPSKDNYTSPVCLQLTGTHRGAVMSYDGYYKAVKRAAAAVGIEYNVGTHSPRKTFGWLNRMIHPNDYDSMELLQAILNHSDVKTTRRYIGLNEEKSDQYYSDTGDFFTKYIIQGEEYTSLSSNPVITLDVQDLRDVVRMAYETGMSNAKVGAHEHLEAITSILSMIEGLAK